jgi:MarR family transcriptional regulator, 2-MHQ and catechol-resistance regulon repressor
MESWSLNIRIIMELVRIGEQYKKEESRNFRKYGLTFAQHNVLCILDAELQGQNSMTRVSGKMVTTGGNLTGIAKRLEKRGLLLRKKEPRDERKTILQITPEGRKKLAAIKRKREKSAEILLEHLSEKEKRAFLMLLTSLQVGTERVTLPS